MGPWLTFFENNTCNNFSMTPRRVKAMLRIIHSFISLDYLLKELYIQCIYSKNRNDFIYIIIYLWLSNKIHYINLNFYKYLSSYTCIYKKYINILAGRRWHPLNFLSNTVTLYDSRNLWKYNLCIVHYLTINLVVSLPGKTCVACLLFFFKIFKVA